MRLSNKETDIVRACLDWLALHRIKAWRTNNTGIFSTYCACRSFCACRSHGARSSASASARNAFNSSTCGAGRSLCASTHFTARSKQSFAFAASPSLAWHMARKNRSKASHFPCPAARLFSSVAMASVQRSLRYRATPRVFR